MSNKIAIVSVLLFGMFRPPVHVQQSIPCDFVIFADQFSDEVLDAVRKMRGIVYDCSVYRRGLYYARDFVGPQSGAVNSFQNNTHPLVWYLFMKQNLHRLPELSQYDQVIWVEPTIHITDPLFAEQCLFSSSATPGAVGVYPHPVYRNVGDQTHSCISSRFTEQVYMGHPQPLQDVTRQFVEYGLDPGSAVFETQGVIVYPHFKSDETRALLDTWWEQTMKYTTNEELGFVYSVRTHNITLALLPTEVRTTMVRFVAPLKC